MSTKKLTWANAIEKVMLENNYFADIKTLNKEAVKIYKEFHGGIEGKTPEATISEKLLRGKKFTKIHPGLWALTEHLDKLPNHINPKNEKRELKIIHSVSTKKLTWANAIEKVMLENNYFADIKTLNKEAVKIYKEFHGGIEGKTPEATISEKLLRGKKFTKIHPGLWALTEHLDKLPNHINPKNEKQGLETTHSLIQGYLIEIGNMRKFRTFCPDKNRYFMDKKLGDIITLDKCPQFTHESIVESVKKIDVIWFNEMNYPAHIIEVEHTTNFKNSLLKFLQLQHFQTEMMIVADKDRREKYDRVLSWEAFKPISERVKFSSYDDVAHAYSIEEQAVSLNF